MKIIKAVRNWYFRRKFKRRNRSVGGDLVLIVVLGFFGLFSLFPLIYTLTSAFKPFSEIFMYPPRLTVENPTLNNFFDLGTIIEDFTIPLSRYIFNTMVITGLGTFGTVLLGSLAAYPLAKYEFPGSKLMSNLIVYALMFSTSVTAIPNYLIMSALGIVDTYWAVILPAVGGTLGLYLMKNFMVQVPDDMLEAAKIDGATEFGIFFKVVMPLCKPAWITLVILSFQQMWGTTRGVHLFGGAEALKLCAVSAGQRRNIQNGRGVRGISSDADRANRRVCIFSEQRDRDHGNIRY